jgi:hypothetical protein
LPEDPEKQVLNVINMSSSATDQTPAGIVENAADKIKKKTAEKK